MIAPTFALSQSLPELIPGELHVWRWRAMVGDESTAMSLLSAMEQARVERLREPAARAARLSSRAGLRLLLGGYLQRAPATVPIRLGRLGRPHLDGIDGPNFNISHSGQWVALVVGQAEALGIDIEQIRSRLPSDRLIERVASPRERAVLSALSDNERRLAFYRLWTRKEAIMKATGGSVFHNPSALDVSLGEAARPTVYQSRREAEGRWTLCHLPMDELTAGAVAVSQGSWTVRAFDGTLMTRV